MKYIMEDKVYCPCCKVKRLQTQFIKNDKQMKSCDVCRQRSLDYNATHKEIVNKRSNEYYQSHREEQNARSREYRLRNNESIKAKANAKNKLLRDLLYEQLKK